MAKVKIDFVRLGKLVAVGAGTHMGIQFVNSNLKSGSKPDSFMGRFGGVAVPAGAILGSALMVKNQCLQGAIVAGAAPSLLYAVATAGKLEPIQKYSMLAGDLAGNNDGPMQLTFKSPAEFESFVASLQTRQQADEQVPVLHGEFLSISDDGTYRPEISGDALEQTLAGRFEVDDDDEDEEDDYDELDQTIAGDDDE